MAASPLPALPTLDPLLEPGAKPEGDAHLPSGVPAPGVTARQGGPAETPRPGVPPGLALLPESPRQPLCQALGRVWAGPRDHGLCVSVSVTSSPIKGCLAPCCPPASGHLLVHGASRQRPPTHGWLPVGLGWGCLSQTPQFLPSCSSWAWLPAPQPLSGHGVQPPPGPQPPRWRWPCQPLALSPPCDSVHSALGLPGQAAQAAPREGAQGQGAAWRGAGLCRPDKALVLIAELPWAVTPALPISFRLPGLQPTLPSAPGRRRLGLGDLWPQQRPGGGSVRGHTAKPAQELKQPVWEVGCPWGPWGSPEGRLPQEPWLRNPQGNRGAGGEPPSRGG